ncbi:RNA-directed DNA polymerase [Tanacetum coccineum]
MRKDRFPPGRYGKLQDRADGLFRVLKRINDNAYKIDLPGSYGVSATFNVADLTPYVEADDFHGDSGTSHFLEGEDDTDGPDGSSPVDQRAVDENEAEKSSFHDQRHQQAAKGKKDDEEFGEIHWLACELNKQTQRKVTNHLPIPTLYRTSTTPQFAPKPGPTKTETPTVTTAPLDTSGPLRCFKCQGLGHLKRDCPNKQLVAFVDDVEPKYDTENEDASVTLYPDQGEALIVQRQKVLNFCCHTSG